MAKMMMVDRVSGKIVAGEGDNSFSVTDLTMPKTLRAQGLQSGDILNVVVENYAGDGWEPYTEGQGQVQLSLKRRSVTPLEIGVFAVAGSVGGSVIIYTEDATESQYWSEVPDSALSKPVLVAWPRSKRTVTVDGAETEERIELKDYTDVKPGKNGTSLVFCGGYESGSNNYPPGGAQNAEWRDRYQAKFGNIIFNETLAAWIADNAATDK